MMYNSRMTVGIITIMHYHMGTLYNMRFIIILNMGVGVKTTLVTLIFSKDKIIVNVVKPKISNVFHAKPFGLAHCLKTCPYIDRSR